MHELWCVSGSTMTNITPLIGSISWRSNVNELGEQLDFDIAFNDTRYFPKNPVDLGSLIILKNDNKEVNRTVVIEESRNGRGAINYTCFDYAFYLNKSKEVYQFNSMPANSAVKTILNKAGVSVGMVSLPGIPITRIYNEKTHSEVIKDILDIVEKETGQKYRMEIKLGKLYIEKQTDKIIRPTFKLALNIDPKLCVNAISNPTRTKSISDMKNSIKIITTNEYEVKVVAEVKNDSLIKQYGLLQEVTSVTEEDIDQANQIAKNMLKDLGKVFEENSITIPGHDDIRAGRILEIEEPVTGMRGKYIISDCNHTVGNGVHMCSVGLGVI